VCTDVTPDSLVLLVPASLLQYNKDNGETLTTEYFGITIVFCLC
jgi:hypothetical protein